MAHTVLVGIAIAKIAPVFGQLVKKVSGAADHGATSTNRALVRQRMSS